MEIKLLAMTFIIFCFSKGLAYNECQRCKCCKNGETRCNNSASDYCMDGCIDGYTGNRCLHVCKSYSTTCLTCTNSISLCTHCKDGKYNSQFTDCRESCKPDCKACISNDNCTECEPGRYGTLCKQICGRGCLNGTCNNRSGYCRCRTGFIGDKCDNCNFGKYGTNCDKQCPAACRYNFCSVEGNCLSCKDGFFGKKCDRCIDGKFGNNCDKNCSDLCSACYSLTNCSACVKKHWGSTCKQCPKNCLDCSSESFCSSCDIGFYGLTCSQRCHGNCLHSRCDQLTGYCSEGCIAGFHGNHCNMNCSHNCKNHICDRVHGDCSQGCKSSYSGAKCTTFVKCEVCNGNNKVMMIGAAVGGSCMFVVIVVLVLAVILLRKRLTRLAKSSYTLTLSDIKDNYNMAYSNLEETEMSSTSCDNGETKYKGEKFYVNSNPQEKCVSNNEINTTKVKRNKHPDSYENVTTDALVHGNQRPLEIEDQQTLESLVASQNSECPAVYENLTASGSDTSKNDRFAPMIRTDFKGKLKPKMNLPTEVIGDGDQYYNLASK